MTTFKETTKKPYAFEKVVQKWVWLKRPNATTNTIERVKMPAHPPEETERSAFCFTHRKHSKQLVGENEAGWVFACAGIKPTGDGKVQPDYVAHYFIARPPK